MDTTQNIKPIKTPDNRFQSRIARFEKLACADDTKASSKEKPCEEVQKDFPEAEAMEDVQVTEAREDVQVTEATEDVQVTEATEDVQVTHVTEDVQVTHVTEDVQVTHVTEDVQVTHVTEDVQVTEATEHVQVTEATEHVQVTHVTEDVQVTHVTEDVQVTEATEDVQVTHVTEDVQVTHVTEDVQVTHVTEDVQVTHVTEDVPKAEATEDVQRDATVRIQENIFTLNHRIEALENERHLLHLQTENKQLCNDCETTAEHLKSEWETTEIFQEQLHLLEQPQTSMQVEKSCQTAQMDAKHEEIHNLALQNVTCMEMAAVEEVKENIEVKEEVTAAIEEVQEHVEVQVIVNRIEKAPRPPQVRRIQAREETTEGPQVRRERRRERPSRWRRFLNFFVCGASRIEEEHEYEFCLAL
ncbi:hypothetical protein D5F01_LYC04367 [Larimichthys crocea]|uniref:Uncharacterized protein n=1 Tax=Larimichthys crocea TaxID=215358 RepID=A0A6G0J2L3_LARCR|nr:hypothetical protein D5F01_LYC04367 [Larimichthys crocea]